MGNCGCSSSGRKLAQKQPQKRKQVNTTEKKNTIRGLVKRPIR